MGIKNLVIKRERIPQLKIIQYIEIEELDDSNYERTQSKSHIIVSSWGGQGKYWYKKSMYTGRVSKGIFYTLYRKPCANELWWLILNVTSQKQR